jgi:hypothetical protein
LVEFNNQQRLRSALENLPRTLDETYAWILETIPEDNLEDAITILRLLTWSERPLRLEEVVDAIAVQPDVSPSFDPDNRMPEPRDILRICSSLVVLTQRPYKHDDPKYSGFDDEDDRSQMDVTELQLAHFSVKEYLISKRVTSWLAPDLAELSARSSITKLCLAYLSDLNHRLSPKDVRVQSAFSEYCARYWTSHAKTVDEVDTKLQARIVRFLDDRENACLTCYNLHDPEEPWTVGGSMKRETDRPASLYYVSLTGLVTGAGASLDRGADVNAEGGRFYGSVLQAASAHGHEKIVQLLLDRGPDLLDLSGCYGSVLQAASIEGHDEVVQLLLDRGADVNTQTG